MPGLLNTELIHDISLPGGSRDPVHYSIHDSSTCQSSSTTCVIHQSPLNSPPPLIHLPSATLHLPRPPGYNTRPKVPSALLQHNIRIIRWALAHGFDRLNRTLARAG